MNLNDLDNRQMILLVLLVSFVSSIATGIVTVSLLAAVPQPVVHTINQVVQKTIERVVPGAIQTTHETVVIKDEDLVPEAARVARAGMVALYKIDDLPTTDAKVAPSPALYGVAVSPTDIITDAVDAISSYAVLSGTVRLKIEKVRTIPNTTLALYHLLSSDTTNKVALAPVSIIPTSLLPAQKILLLADATQSEYVTFVAQSRDADTGELTLGGIPKHTMTLYGFTLSGELAGYAPASSDSAQFFDASVWYAPAEPVKTNPSSNI